jgi:hypothetical protein
LAAEAGGGGGGGDGEGDAKEEKRAARSTRCGSEGKVGVGTATGRSSSMAWEVGRPSSAVNVPPLPVEAAAEAGARAGISPPAAGRSGVGEEWRIGAALRRRGK